jgi:ParB family chromosome partitioning protein
MEVKTMSNEPSVHHQLAPGDVVVDRESEPSERNDAIVVNTPSKAAHDWYVQGRGLLSEDNPGYSDDAPVIVVVFRSALDEHYPHYTGVSPLQLSELHEQSIPYYAFPEPRLIRVGEVEPIEIPLSMLSPAPYHSRNFDVAENREFIDEIAARGHPDPLPLVRVRDDGFEIVNGHKRVWASAVAGVSSIPCHTVHQEPGEYARSWAKRHLGGYDQAEQAAAVERLQKAGFGDVAAEYGSVETDGGADQ